MGLHVDRVTRTLKRRMEEVGEPYVNVTQLVEAVLHDQLMEDHTRYVKYITYMLHAIKNTRAVELSLKNSFQI